jgi:hypothetical protein
MIFLYRHDFKNNILIEIIKIICIMFNDDTYEKLLISS